MFRNSSGHCELELVVGCGGLEMICTDESNLAMGSSNFEVLVKHVKQL